MGGGLVLGVLFGKGDRNLWLVLGQGGGCRGLQGVLGRDFWVLKRGSGLGVGLILN